MHKKPSPKKAAPTKKRGSSLQNGTYRINAKDLPN